MYRMILTSILFLFASTATAYDSCLTGSWFEDPGEGISIEVLSDTWIVGYWYGYGTTGQHRWYTFSVDETGAGKLYTTQNSINRHNQNVGRVALTIVDQDHIVFQYDIIVDADNAGWCLSAGCSGALITHRLTQPVPCLEQPTLP